MDISVSYRGAWEDWVLTCCIDIAWRSLVTDSIWVIAYKTKHFCQIEDKWCLVLNINEWIWLNRMETHFFWDFSGFRQFWRFSAILTNFCRVSAIFKLFAGFNTYISQLSIQRVIRIDNPIFRLFLTRACDKTRSRLLALITIVQACLSSSVTPSLSFTQSTVCRGDSASSRCVYVALL